MEEATAEIEVFLGESTRKEPVWTYADCVTYPPGKCLNLYLPGKKFFGSIRTPTPSWSLCVRGSEGECRPDWQKHTMDVYDKPNCQGKMSKKTFSLPHC